MNDAPKIGQLREWLIPPGGLFLVIEEPDPEAVSGWKDAWKIMEQSGKISVFNGPAIQEYTVCVQDDKAFLSSE